jgi:hypothetical protein
LCRPGVKPGVNTEDAEGGERRETKTPRAEVQSGAFWVLGIEVGEVLANSTAIAGQCCESGEAEEAIPCAQSPPGKVPDFLLVSSSFTPPLRSLRQPGPRGSPRFGG